MTTLGSVVTSETGTSHFCAAFIISTLRAWAPAIRIWLKYIMTARLPTIAMPFLPRDS